MMEKFWELLEESVLVQSIIALGCIIVILILYASQQAVPPTLVDIVMLILGFYFGSKSTQQTQTIAKSQRQMYQAGKSDAQKKYE